VPHRVRVSNLAAAEMPACRRFVWTGRNRDGKSSKVRISADITPWHES